VFKIRRVLLNRTFDKAMNHKFVIPSIFICMQYMWVPIIQIENQHRTFETPPIVFNQSHSRFNPGGPLLRSFMYCTCERQIVEENCALLGYYAERSGNFLPIIRDNLPIPSSGGILGPWRWDRYVFPKCPQEITITRCVVTWKSAVIIYFAAESWISQLVGRLKWYQLYANFLK